MYRHSRHTYIINKDGTDYHICVQKNEGRYEATIIGIGGAKIRKYGTPTFDTIEKCQDYINAEAKAHGWHPAKISSSILY